MYKTSLAFLTLLLVFQSTAQPACTLRIKAQMPPSLKSKAPALRGSLSPLSWEKSLPMQAVNDKGLYEASVEFPASQVGKPLEFKLVYTDKKPVYELNVQPNRLALLSAGVQNIEITWDEPVPFDVQSLPLLQPEALLADFAVAKEALLAIHPGLYRYRSPQQMDSIFRHFETVFSRPMSYADAFLQFSRLTASIRCGHTYPNFFNQTGLIQQVVLDRADKLPFAFRVVQNKMVVSASTSEKPLLPVGKEVISINGVPVAELLAQIATLVKADGSNDAKRYAELNTFGIGPFEAFDAYFPLLYPPKDQLYTLVINRPGNDATETVEVGTISRSQRSKRLKELNPEYPTTADDLWKLQFPRPDIAYLQLGTFDSFQFSFDWYKWLKNAFEEIKKKKAQNLVIDIRWNEGGQDEILLALGQFLAKKPIRPVDREELVRYQTLPATVRPYVFTWDSKYFDLTQFTNAYNDRFFRLKQPDAVEIKPSSNAFGGNTYLLVNAANSSATFYFAEIARENNLATLVGETTGGSQKGLNAGVLFFLRMPNSGIEIDIPIIGNFSTNKPEGGIPPNVAVVETIEDIRSGKDKYLETVIQLISSQQK